MEILALLSKKDDLIISRVKNALKRYTVYPLRSIEELEDIHSNIPLNLILVDTGSFRLSVLEDFIEKLDDDIVVLITPEKLKGVEQDNLPKSVSDILDVETISSDLPVIVERAIEKQRLKTELRSLKQAHKAIASQRPQPHHRIDNGTLPGLSAPAQGGGFINDKVVINFAKMLTASFDMRKLFDHFIDSVMEIARVSKMSVMLKEKDEYHIKTHYGLAPSIVDKLVLKKESELVAWLKRTGRIMQRPVTCLDTESIDINREMELLKCQVSFPMIYKGKLIGIFNIGSKVMEGPFHSEELEIIYVLCNYLAAAVKDIDLYHNMWYQKEFTNNIISSMSSGMIAIDRDDRITVFNQQAAEILKHDPLEIIGNDLRTLPSPLGDLLYETMVSGTAYKRHEVTLQPMGLTIGINSYRLLDEQQEPVGAGILFSDLSDSKKLEEQLRKAEKLKAVNDLMAKIAHEIRNPLTSIHTYTQLLNEKVKDDDLNEFYVATVNDSIRRLDGLIDKLVTFSSTQDYHFISEDVNSLLTEVENAVLKNIPEAHELSKESMDKSVFIRADKKQLIRALTYIIQSIIEMNPEGTDIRIYAGTIQKDVPMVEILISYTGGTSVEEEKKRMTKQLLDIKNLGSELNIPIGHKIIEGHNGSLDITSREGVNKYIIRLPIAEKESEKASLKGGRVSE